LNSFNNIHSAHITVRKKKKSMNSRKGKGILKSIQRLCNIP
jgi:hypothetical protein